MRSHAFRLALIGLLSAVLLCANAPAEPHTTAYVMKDTGDRYAQYAPVFVVERSGKAYNRVGSPAARARASGEPRVYVDPEAPAYYVQEQQFKTPKGTYTNLLYRVHFVKSPFTLVPFNASAGRNVGLMAIVTLDAQGTPLFVTTVHSCGCYHAVLPTSYVPKEDYPAQYDFKGMTVYGEHLPGRLDYPETFSTDVRPVIFLRPDTHRVMDIKIERLADVQKNYKVVAAEEKTVEDLDAIPVKGGDGTTSFYYESGPKKGLVKGAFKPWEALLFGWWGGDMHVGQDRKYGQCNDVGQLFYTTLNPAKRDKSDMWHFDRFLEFNGWKV
jgi:hypothetical protein